MAREAVLLELAKESGFDLAGIAPLSAPPDAGRFRAWLDGGYHGGPSGSLSYLQRNRDRIADPRSFFPGPGSILVVGLAHSRAAIELEGGGKVARYAGGRDYHNVMGRMLRKLARRLEKEGFSGHKRAIVDAGPLLERSHAAEAGLGFLSKAANLLHPRFGPWFFLGELLLPGELEPTSEPPPGSCGTCTACLDACPTQAILEPGHVNASLCISYQTIENRSWIPSPLREKVGDWAFGCDVCSEVCPWGKAAPDFADRWGTHDAVSRSGLVQWLDVPGDFSEFFRGSPLQRPKREGLARNAAIALGNRPSENGRATLLKALSFDPSPLVRGTSFWALARAHSRDRGVVEAMDAALARETDPTARHDMKHTLGEGPG